MPYSYGAHRSVIAAWFKENHFGDGVVDIGPGEGAYSDLLKPLVGTSKIKAIEIYAPYIMRFLLPLKYNEVLLANALNVTPEYYRDSVVILGDVLEHFSIGDAQELIGKIQLYAKAMVTSVPYNYPQGESEGNIYEAHLQPDLTHEIVLERYPTIGSVIAQDRLVGVYAWKRTKLT